MSARPTARRIGCALGRVILRIGAPSAAALLLVAGVGCIGGLDVDGAFVGGDTMPSREEHARYFPIATGSHAAADCDVCHGEFATFTQFNCLGCHEHAPEVTDPTHLALADYAYDSVSCYGCHADGSAARHHPADFAAATVHGPALKMQTEDCRTCHGADLTGVGSATSCDLCHTLDAPGSWRTTCTYCHGGDDNPTGAPPGDLDGTSDRAAMSFPAHTIHVTDGMKRAYDCVECHLKAKDVLSQGHIFDETPGVGEVDFGAGLSAGGTYDAAVGCANLYCHGNGRTDAGFVEGAAAPRDCESCHAGSLSPSADWDAMSGTHQLHLGLAAVTCADCHATTTADGRTISEPARHVDGSRDVAFSAAGFAFDAATQLCTGSCHGVEHQGLSWALTGATARFHPPGFSSPLAHGPELELGRSDCRGCHGATLTGGAIGPSCDGCHRADWRSDCTYCHGGGANQTGAPPRDLGAQLGTQSQSFRAHTAHVTSRIAPAADCTTCHRKPADVLSAGHTFDASRGAAEVTMAGGLSPTGTYDGAGTCANLYCHGNGRGNTGTIKDGAAQLLCSGCHPAMGSGATAWATMSGDHSKHLKLSGVTCADCHLDVTANGTAIANVALHVDGARQVTFLPAGYSYDPATKACSGPACHGKTHNGLRW